MPYRDRPPEFARLLAHAVDAKAGYFPGHSDGVAYLVRVLAAEGGFTREEIGQAQIAAILHDVGKLMIPDRILTSSDRLGPQDWECMKTHSAWGAEFVRRIDGATFAADWVRHHHEHYDGSGYPDGLAGDDIPLVSRLILVADAFHVMTTERPYQRARSLGAALEELDRHSGTQFCPVVVSWLFSARKSTAGA